MQEEREKKKMGRAWLVKGFAVVGIAFSVWTMGGVVLSQTPACQLGVYDCVGAIYLYLGNVGIGTQTPGQKLSVAGTIESTAGGYKFPDGTMQTTGATFHGKQRFTTVGTTSWPVPAGVTKVWVTMVGGGGGARGGWGTTGYGGGGAGAITMQEFNITGATSINVTVGGGGTDQASSCACALPGGNSSFGTYYTVYGGGGGTQSVAGGSGSSGPYGKDGTGGSGTTGGVSIFSNPAYFSGVYNTAGASGKGYGGGGAGATGGAGAGGGSGSPGFVLVEW